MQDCFKILTLLQLHVELVCQLADRGISKVAQLAYLTLLGCHSCSGFLVARFKLIGQTLELSPINISCILIKCCLLLGVLLKGKIVL